MYMTREYTGQNVYDALQDRLKYIFEEFDNIFVSFSGGKDSGLLLNLTLDFQKKYYPDKKIGVFHQDFEAQYTVTTEYVERTFNRIKDETEPYWVLPADGSQNGAEQLPDVLVSVGRHHGKGVVSPYASARLCHQSAK